VITAGFGVLEASARRVVEGGTVVRGGALLLYIVVMEFEEAQQFWERAGEGVKRHAFRMDPVLRFFDDFSVLEAVEGKLVKFDVEKISDLQDKVDSLPQDAAAEDSGVRDIFAPGSTKNINVRSHKLLKIIKDRLIAIAQSGVLPEVQDEPEQDQGQMPAQNTSRGQEYPAPGTIQQFAQPILMQLGPALPQGAKLNIRAEPDSNAEVVGTLMEGEQIYIYGVHGDWGNARSEAFGTAWILTRNEDLMLLVEAEEVNSTLNPSPAGQVNQLQSQEFQHVQQPKQSQQQNVYRSSPQQQFKENHQVANNPVYHQQTPAKPLQSSYTPPPPGGHSADHGQFVPWEEHHRLLCKVSQLEADMRALRLLLRSWSLDTPQ